MVLLTVVGIGRALVQAPSPVEVVADGVLLLLPGGLSSAAIDTLRSGAKLVLYAGVAVGTLAVGTLVGAVYARRPTWTSTLGIAVAAWLVSGALYAAVGAGAFGAGLDGGLLWHAMSLLVETLLFALALRVFYSLLGLRPATHVEPTTPFGSGPLVTRRDVLVGVGLSGVAAAVGALVWRALPSEGEVILAAPARGPVSLNLPPWDVPGLSPEITPTADFYTVSKNIIDPSVATDTWKLVVDGLVDRPLELTYQQLLALPAVESALTLMCISNSVGGDLWGNATWKGVKLAALLQQAGVQAGAVDAVFTGADDYKDSVAVERALDPDALLAWEMNGQPLTRAHGAPARLLIPDIYGMKNVKWVTRITLVPNDVKGYWQTRGWDDTARYQVASRIDSPRGRSPVKQGTLDVAGVAFAGARGIRRVEVTVDGGKSWTDAEIKPALARNTWQLWKARVVVPPEVRDVRVRATDGVGERQTPDEASPYPAGSTGWHTVNVFLG
ncbi:MAG: molybdopterin-dependent oxidoreductase [Chloroflexi bacterium]|nr:molybdopterin-dependent oxidoreductase [Chloroflexota bacterium]